MKEPKFGLLEAVKIARPDPDEVSCRALVIGWQRTSSGSFLYSLLWEDLCEGRMFEAGLEKATLVG